LVDLRKIEVMQSDIEERKMGIKGWRRLKRIPQGSVEMVLSGARYAVSSFSFTTPLKYTMQLEWVISIPSPNSSSSTPSSVTHENCSSRKPELDFPWFKV